MNSWAGLPFEVKLELARRGTGAMLRLLDAREADGRWARLLRGTLLLDIFRLGLDVFGS